MARIYGLESENVAKKCAVRFGVFTVDNYVSARNHLLLQPNIGNSATWTRDWPLHGHHVLHPAGLAARFLVAFGDSARLCAVRGRRFILRQSREAGMWQSDPVLQSHLPQAHEMRVSYLGTTALAGSSTTPAIAPAPGACALAVVIDSTSM